MISVRLSVDVSSPYRAILNREISDETIQDVESKLECYLFDRGVDGNFHGLMRISTLKIPVLINVKYDYYEESSDIAVFLVRSENKIFSCRISLPYPEYLGIFRFRIEAGENAASLDDKTVELLINIPAIINDGQRAIDEHLANVANFKRIIESYKDRISSERREILKIRRIQAKLDKMSRFAKELGYPV